MLRLSELMQPVLDIFVGQLKNHYSDLIEEEREKAVIELKNENKKVEQLVQGWIENDIPIPIDYKRKYPLWVASVCIKHKREDLEPELVKKYHSIKKKENRFENIILIGFIIIFLAIWGGVIFLFISLIKSC